MEIALAVSIHLAQTYSLGSVYGTKKGQESKEQEQVAKRPFDCCVGEFWPNVTGRRYFADII